MHETNFPISRPGTRPFFFHLPTHRIPQVIQVFVLFTARTHWTEFGTRDSRPSNCCPHPVEHCLPYRSQFIPAAFFRNLTRSSQAEPSKKKSQRTHLSSVFFEISTASTNPQCHFLWWDRVCSMPTAQTVSVQAVLALGHSGKK